MRKSLSLAVSLASLEVGHPFLATTSGTARWASYMGAQKEEEAARKAAALAGPSDGYAATAYHHAMAATTRAVSALEAELNAWLHTPRAAWRVELKPHVRLGQRDGAGKWVEHFWASEGEARAAMATHATGCPAAKVVYGDVLGYEPR